MDGADLVHSTQFELWRAYGWEVSKCESDPTVLANWTLPTPVGDETCPITGLDDVRGQLYFFKADGTVWGQQSTTDNVPVFSGIEESAQEYNGRVPHNWLDQLYFRVGPGFYRLTGGQVAQVERVGPERLMTNTSPVRGPVRAFAGFSTHYGFAGVYNPYARREDGTIGGSSFLLRYGNWVPSEGDEEGAAVFSDGYDGAQVVWEGKKIASLGVCTTEAVMLADGEAGNPRLYAGFEDGTYGWIRLPRERAEPVRPRRRLRLHRPAQLPALAPAQHGRPGRPEGLPVASTAAGRTSTPTAPCGSATGWTPPTRATPGTTSPRT